MKPQIVMQEVGHHNRDLGASSARILRGGSWKKQRIIRIKPAADMIPAKCADSHESLIYPPNQGVVRMLALGQEVGEAYSNCIEQIVSHPELSKWEYILTLEHDNCPPQDGVLKLIEDMEAHPEFACIGGLYWTKGEGGVPQIWGDPTDPVTNFRPIVPEPGKLVECCGTGMGFNLWRTKMFRDERIAKPWFRTKASKEEGVGTQDLAFWSEARKAGYRCAIDTRILVGHYDVANDQMW
jgi:hypothetical protein